MNKINLLMMIAGIRAVDFISSILVIVYLVIKWVFCVPSGPARYFQRSTTSSPIKSIGIPYQPQFKYWILYEPMEIFQHCCNMLWRCFKNHHPRILLGVTCSADWQICKENARIKYENKISQTLCLIHKILECQMSTQFTNIIIIYTFS